MQVNIEKKHVYILSVLMFLVIGTFVYAGTANYLTGAATVSSGEDSPNAFGHNMVCVTASRTNNDDIMFKGSQPSGEYTVYTGIVKQGSLGKAHMICEDSFIMTGCTGEGDKQWNQEGDYIEDLDIAMEENGCRAGSNDINPTVYIRCCQVG